MTPAKKHDSWWVIPIVILLSPFILAVVTLWALYSFALYLLVWMTWLSRGRDILFVYSDSPHWKDYIEEEILPRVKSRSIVLNWSERRNWIGRFSLATMLFRHFGGHKEFNPIAIHFRFMRIHNTYRFWEPIRRWRKKNDRQELDALLNRFYQETKI